MAKQSTAKKQAAFLEALEDGPMTAPEMVEELGLPKEEVRDLAKALIESGQVKKVGNAIELVPVKKAKKKAEAPKSKKKAKDEDEDWDDEDDDEDEDEDADEEDEDEEDSDDEDADEDDEDEDEDEDDEEEEAPKKKKTLKGKKGKKEEAVPAKKEKGKKKAQFTMAFKPIDTLTDDELQERIDDGLEAAEELFDDGHEVVAEMIVRAVRKAEKQMTKRNS